MHTTTVRFGDDLWAQLVAAATREHCSIGEYVREATTRRLAGRRPANLGPSRHGKEAPTRLPVGPPVSGPSRSHVGE